MKSYEEYISELEKLVSEIEDPKKPLAEVGGDVKRALELIQKCRAMLRQTNEEISKELEDII